MEHTLLNKDACELLDADHVAVKHLFVEYARLAFGSPGAKDRRDLAMKICDELTVHAQIEEEIFYPALEEALPEDQDVLSEAREEHQQAKELIARIHELSADDTQLDDLVAKLARVIEHHVKEERDEIFPKARAASGLDLNALEEQLRGRQEELMKNAGARGAHAAGGRDPKRGRRAQRS